MANTVAPRRLASCTAAEPTQAGNAKLAETLAEMNARFKNVEVELLEWPDELHKKLGKMTKLALVTRPVEKTEGKLPLLPLLLSAIDEGRLSAEYFDGTWHDVGTPERLADLDVQYST